MDAEEFTFGMSSLLALIKGCRALARLCILSSGCEVSTSVAPVMSLELSPDFGGLARDVTAVLQFVKFAPLNN
jgi:hypothetical protein